MSQIGSRQQHGRWAVVGSVVGLALVAAGGLLLAEGCGSQPAQPAGFFRATPIAAVEGTRLHNLHRLTDQVYAGAAPDGAAAFRDLADLGVRTIISVDGATPDQVTAAQFGQRYIHLPTGYDGVPVATQQAIAKAILESDGGVYIHCHHGKHRGAAAAASGCVVAGLIDQAQALAVLQQMQTGKNYRGLWRDTRAARRVAAAELHALQVDYRPARPIPPLTHSMVQIDAIGERLQLCQAGGWRTPLDHPDLDPPHEALQIKEQFAELLRTADSRARPADFQQWAAASESAAADLETALRAGQADRATAGWERLQAACRACHQQYRNGPPAP